MKKLFFLIYLILSASVANAQTIINLNYDEENRYKEFTFVNPKDSIFLDFDHNEDMGHRYGFHYVVRNNIPDNEYKIYVNKILGEHFVIKNAKLNGIKKKYYDTGAVYSSESFEKGIKNGNYEFFNKNGKLKEYAKYINGNPYIITELGIEGKVNGRRYYLPDNPNNCIRYEMYDNDGRIARIQNTHEDNSGLYSQEAFKNGKLNYTTILQYSKGTFTLEFEENNLIKAKFEGSGKVTIIR